MDLLFPGTVRFSDGIFLATDDSNRVKIPASVPYLSLPVWQIEDNYRG